VLAAAVAASLAQLALHGASITRGTAAPQTKDTEVHAFLRERAEELRSQGGATIVRGTQPPTGPWPGQFPIDGLRDLNYYSHADARTLQPLRRLLDRHWQQLGVEADFHTRAAGKGYLTSTLPARMLGHPWFDLVGLRYVLSNQPGLEKGRLGLGAPVAAIRQRGAFFVHERKGALPRAFVVPKVEALEHDDAVLDALTATTLRPAAQAYVVAGELEAPIAPAPDGAAPRQVTFVADHASHIELHCASGEGRALVLADTFLSGWRATVDGREVPIVRCNHSQRLVEVPTTACRVVFTYEAPGLMLGLWLAVFATVCAIATWQLVRYRMRRELPAHRTQA